MDQDHVRCTLLRLACDDALGRPIEFKSASVVSAEYCRLNEMVRHGTWNQPTSTITDDIDQALCITRSLVDEEGFDPADIADRFVG